MNIFLKNCILPRLVAGINTLIYMESGFYSSRFDGKPE